MITVSGTDGEVNAEIIRGALGAIRAAADGRVLARETLERILAERALPARCYRPVMEAIGDAGIHIMDVEVVAPDEGLRADETGGWNRNGYDHFLKRNWHAVLTAEEEHDLGVKVQRGRLAQEALKSETVPLAAKRELRRRVRNGDRAAEDLVLANLRLVSKMAWKLHKRAGPALELEDLFQEGVLGLSHAISKFEPERGFKLSTYATWWIRQSMDRAVDDKEQAIRLPVHVWNKKRAVWRAERELRTRGRHPGIDEIAAEVGLPAETVRELKTVGQRLSSLDRRIGEGASTEGDLIPDPHGIDPSQIVEQLGSREEAWQRLATLPERDREIMVQRFGIGGGGVRTLNEIGAMFGVTRERIRQIETKALESLRTRTVTGADRAMVRAEMALVEETVASVTAKQREAVSAETPSSAPPENRVDRRATRRASAPVERRSSVSLKYHVNSPAAGRASAPAEPRPEVPAVIGEVSDERRQRWVTVAELFPDGLIG